MHAGRRLPETAASLPGAAGAAAEAIVDAVRGNWVDRRAPRPLRPYLRLARADRPIGSWLLLLPCWWAVALAVAAAPARAGPWAAWVAAASALGAVLMRGAGCTWNDIADRDLDAAVARTRARPLPAGQVTVPRALAWMLLQAGLALGILLGFPPLAVALGAGSLVLVAVYPFAKRFTWWPQVFLGLAFNWGALLAWAALTGTLAPPALLLYLGGIAWTLFYDTIYAHQDKEDDALVGIRSTARLFGEGTHAALALCLVAAVALVGLAVLVALLPAGRPAALAVALAGVAAFGLHLLWQLRRLETEDPAVCLRLFRSNRDAGLLPALLFAAAAWL